MRERSRLALTKGTTPYSTDGTTKLMIQENSIDLNKRIERAPNEILWL